MLNLTHINEMKREKTNYLLIIFIFSFAYKKLYIKMVIVIYLLLLNNVELFSERNFNVVGLMIILYRFIKR